MSYARAVLNYITEREPVLRRKRVTLPQTQIFKPLYFLEPDVVNL